MLSARWWRVAAGAAAGAAVVGAVSYREKISAMPQSWKDKVRHEAFRPAYNNPPRNYPSSQPLFSPSFDFPKKMPPEDYKELPWMKIDFKTEPKKYLWALLDYCFEGNTECDFRVEDNRVRRWYYAPWLASRPFGREPIHGLTMDRPSNPGYIAKEDKAWEQTWAAGFYNSYGGYTIGKFWENPGKPTLTANVSFPPGTVSFKILFTQATERDVPSLEGSKVWQAAIGVPDPPIPPTASSSEAARILEQTMSARDRGPDPYPLRLIQVDVMVRDPRSEIGWVFGTFMYHKDVPAADPWRRLVPMTLQWGNDPDLTPEMYYEQGRRPTETWTNPSVRELRLLPKGRPYLGYLERANGIVDGFTSACASCHSTASAPVDRASRDGESSEQTAPGMTPDTMRWFRNVKCGEPFQEGVLSLDYSMQLNSGFGGYRQWLRKNPEPKPALSRLDCFK
ncbi:uncharacterized protein LOC118421395 [Branchiostoma floridae]|uniref:Uncharacterized protein LOC118421395 n=1 Tax=Branchiostoma floridae TaxID=7739 RepID=C3ZYJ1_BRAFL|nr:uncharacterized protein LOC118421395 [Branchiostoma floridae]|eukprot:XP_002586402.1 hypothetical protein BRAFLDRAFT_108541 [Branchiostoma floridae]